MDRATIIKPKPPHPARGQPSSSASVSASSDAPSCPLLLDSCRFCLQPPAASPFTPRRRLPPHTRLPHSEWAQLFEAATGQPLGRRAGYSEWVCCDCEHRLRVAAASRNYLLRIAGEWQQLLDGRRTTVDAAAVARSRSQLNVFSDNSKESDEPAALDHEQAEDGGDALLKALKFEIGDEGLCGEIGVSDGKQQHDTNEKEAIGDDALLKVIKVESSGEGLDGEGDESTIDELMCMSSGGQMRQPGASTAAAAATTSSALDLFFDDGFDDSDSNYQNNDDDDDDEEDADEAGDSDSDQPLASFREKRRGSSEFAALSKPKCPRISSAHDVQNNGNSAGDSNRPFQYSYKNAHKECKRQTKITITESENDAIGKRSEARKHPLKATEHFGESLDLNAMFTQISNEEPVIGEIITIIKDREMGEVATQTESHAEYDDGNAVDPNVTKSVLKRMELKLDQMMEAIQALAEQISMQPSKTIDVDRSVELPSLPMKTTEEVARLNERLSDAKLREQLILLLKRREVSGSIILKTRSIMETMIGLELATAFSWTGRSGLNSKSNEKHIFRDKHLIIALVQQTLQYRNSAVVIESDVLRSLQDFFRRAKGRLQPSLAEPAEQTKLDN